MGFDGAGPDRGTQPTWRGVLTMLGVIAVAVVLVFVAYAYMLGDAPAR